MISFTLTSRIVFFTSLSICRFFSNVASISRRLLTTSGPRTPWKHGSGRFSPSYILAKWICPSHTCKWKFTNHKLARFWILICPLAICLIIKMVTSWFSASMVPQTYVGIDVMAYAMLTACIRCWGGPLIDTLGKQELNFFMAGSCLS